MNNFRIYAELYHHGVKGMHWGIRRYQNEDGSLTPAGRRRYGEDLDISDTSRTNVTKIRAGEARRKYDAAKYELQRKKENYKQEKNNIDAKNEYLKQKEKVRKLRHRVYLADQERGRAKDFERGAKLVEKGQTVTGNQFRTAAAFGTSALTAYGFNKFLNHRMNKLLFENRLRAGHLAVGRVMNDIVEYGTLGLAGAYAFKKYYDNRVIKGYNASRWNGSGTIKRFGSSEYEDAIKRRRKTSK